MHQREVILNKIKEILAAAATDAGDRVFRARKDAIALAELPAIVIWQGEDPARPGDINYSKSHDLAVEIELYVANLREPTGASDENSAETALNALQEQVEFALESDFRLGGTCRAMVDQGTGKPEVRNAEVEYAMLQMNIVVTYRTQRTNPAVQA